MNTTTLEKMRKMKFFGMLNAFKGNLESDRQEVYTPDELIATLIESEWDDRQNRKIERHLKNARFRYKAAIEQLNYDTDRNIDKNLMMRFAECSFNSLKRFAMSGLNLPSIVFTLLELKFVALPAILNCLETTPDNTFSLSALVDRSCDSFVLNTSSLTFITEHLKAPNSASFKTAKA
jgi:IstB-like ATP binding protein